MKKRVDNPKPPIQFFTKREDGTLVPQHFWGCGECRTVCFSGGEGQSKKDAENCCKTRRCKCGKELDVEYRDQCDDCQSTVWQEKTEKRLAGLPVVKYDGGPVCELDSDRYYQSMEQMAEEYEDREEPLPEFAHPCDVVTWPGLKASDILEDVQDTIDIDMVEYGMEFVDEPYLQRLLDRWNKKQTLTWWMARVGEKILCTKNGENTSGTQASDQDKREPSTQ